MLQHACTYLVNMGVCINGRGRQGRPRHSKGKASPKLNIQMMAHHGALILGELFPQTYEPCCDRAQSLVLTLVYLFPARQTNKTFLSQSRIHTTTGFVTVLAQGVGGRVPPFPWKGKIFPPKLKFSPFHSRFYFMCLVLGPGTRGASPPGCYFR